jgi:acyl-CoA thioester hydrolase
MSLSHERTFRVRHYECDLFGHVNHAQYLRYCQETAFDASAAAGYDIARYEAMGRMWWVHETDITYHRPLGYGDSAKVRTWVADFGRVRSRRAYEVRNAVTGELAAEALTDWVFLDRFTQRPQPIPAELIAAFFPQGGPVPRPPGGAFPGGAFPSAPPPPPGVFTARRTIEFRDLDMAGHVNNANYMTFFEACSMAVGEAYGWTPARMLDAGFGIFARRYRIEYRQQARLGDEIEMATWVSDARRATAIRHYTMTRLADGALLARAHTLWAWVDVHTGRPTRIPDDFRADFGPNIVD